MGKKIINLVIAVVLIGGFIVFNHTMKERPEISGDVMLMAHDVQFLIREEKGEHETKGIDESTLSTKGHVSLLKFSLLKKWKYDPDKPSDPPKKIADFDGKQVKLVGFPTSPVYVESTDTFRLARTVHTCKDHGTGEEGGEDGLFVKIDLASEMPLNEGQPIMVMGTFRIDPDPDEGFLYRIEGGAMTTAR